jgi:hypothetical protein
VSEKKGARQKTVKTRCEQGPDQDIIPDVRPRAKTTDVIDFNLLVCKANSRVLIYLDNQLLRQADSQDEVSLVLPELSPGSHLLYWSVFPAGDEWQTRAEIKINGAVCFLRRRKSSDRNPTPTGFWFVDIVA